LKALEEWVRVVKDMGSIFIIVPHPCASKKDCERPITTIDEMISYYERDVTLADFQESYLKYDGHLHVFNTDLLFEIMFWFNRKHMNLETHTSLELIQFAAVDDKVGNGFLIVWKVNKRDYRPVQSTYFGRSWDTDAGSNNDKQQSMKKKKKRRNKQNPKE
jgi:hypothetical protein